MREGGQFVMAERRWGRTMEVEGVEEREVVVRRSGGGGGRRAAR